MLTDNDYTLRTTCKICQTEQYLKRCTRGICNLCYSDIMRSYGGASPLRQDQCGDWYRLTDAELVEELAAAIAGKLDEVGKR